MGNLQQQHRQKLMMCIQTTSSYRKTVHDTHKGAARELSSELGETGETLLTSLANIVAPCLLFRVTDGCLNAKLMHLKKEGYTLHPETCLYCRLHTLILPGCCSPDQPHINYFLTLRFKDNPRTKM